MNLSRQSQAVNGMLYEFDSDYQVSYVNYCRQSSLADAMLILTLEKGNERKTFSFTCPEFSDIDKNLVACRGLYVSSVKDPNTRGQRIEVGDGTGCFVYFCARNVKNITPTA